MAVDCYLGLSSLADMLGDMSNVTSDLLENVLFRNFRLGKLDMDRSVMMK